MWRVNSNNLTKKMRTFTVLIPVLQTTCMGPGGRIFREGGC